MLYELIVSMGLTSWEHWAFLATILGTVINTIFLYFLIQQVKLGRQAGEAADRAAKAARAAVKEAMYARIDEQSPRVIAVLDTPLVGGVRPPGEMAWTSDTRINSSRNKNDGLYAGIAGTLINEGKGSARVTLNGYARWIDSDKDELLLTGPVEPSRDAHFLQPGEKVRFWWSESHTVQDWIDAYRNPSPANPHGAFFLEIISADYFEEGVVDHIFLEMSGRPLVPVSDDSTEEWHIPKHPEFAAVAYPIRRAHVKKENGSIQPSWLDTYKEWGELHQAPESQP